MRPGLRGLVPFRIEVPRAFWMTWRSGSPGGGCPGAPRRRAGAPLAPEEEAWVARTRARLARETGYQGIQGTKPQTLAYALTDSPVGLAAWIAEKFHGWSTPGPDGPPFKMEQILTDMMI